MQSNPDAVEQGVITALRRLDDEWESIGSDDPTWTRAVKNAVGRVGKSLGYEIYAAQSEFEENDERGHTVIPPEIGPRGALTRG